MKKKILIIILFILIVLLIILGVFRMKAPRKKSSNEETSKDFMLNQNTTSQVNTSGENSGIYVGVTDNSKENYLFLSIRIDKKSSKEEQISSLISEISTATGYKIDINSIEVDGEKIKIDFAKTSAPFELENSYSQKDSQRYFITSKSVVAKTIFDSINKTLKSYFGTKTEVYFSADSENISIENEVLKINIDQNVSYQNQ